MSYDEFQLWYHYIMKRGSLNIGRRIEQSAGFLSYLYVGSKSKKKMKPEDFMIHEEDKKQATAPVTLEEAMKQWK